MLPDSEMGQTIPPHDRHAISVSLPTWRDHVGWGYKEPWAIERMKSGYPRFFIHESITRLGARILEKYSDPDTQADSQVIFFPSAQIASECLAYYKRYTLEPQASQAQTLAFGIPPSTASTLTLDVYTDLQKWASLHAFICPTSAISAAKAFWQHVGEGVSTRRIDITTRLFDYGLLVRIEGGECCRLDGEGCMPSSVLGEDSAYSSPTRFTNDETDDILRGVWDSLRVDEGNVAKEKIRRDLAKLYSGGHGGDVSKDNVWLYPSGMSAIWNAFRAIMEMRNVSGEDDMDMICYGFTYVDTYKILEKFSRPQQHPKPKPSDEPAQSHVDGVLFYGQSSEEELDDLEHRLESGQRFSALFCEIAGNPLLNCPDFQRIGRLSKKYGFVVVVDDTIATVGNVDVLDVADMVCTSLSKTYSGKCNVMGGSVVLNPTSPVYSKLHSYLTSDFSDTYFPPDSIVLAENGHNFLPRLNQMNTNTLALLDVLSTHPSVKRIYHPLFNSTLSNYRAQMRPHNPNTHIPSSYGYLFTILFHKPADAVTFFDNLDVAKGPSLGTEFTLACAYALLAHPGELEWAANFGVDEYLVRISTGIEEEGPLVETVKRALRCVEARDGRG